VPIAAAFAVVAVLIVVGLGVGLRSRPIEQREQEQAYAAALADLEAGHCAAARDGFQALGDYKDAAARAAECFLRRAGQALEAQQWDLARSLAHEVADHPDAQHIRAESYYRPAINAIERGMWERAVDQIVALNGFAPYYRDLGVRAADIPELRKALWGRYAALWWDHDAVLLATLTGHTDIVQDVLFTPDGRQLLSGSSDGTVRAWSTTGLNNEALFHQHDGVVYSLALSPDGSRLATGSSDGQIRLWSAPDWQSIGTLRGHESWVSDVAFSANGAELASASTDQTVRLWNVWPPMPFGSEGHPWRTLEVGYVAGDRLLVLGEGQRGTWIGWSARSVSHANPVDALSTCAAVQPYGELVAVGTPTGVVHLWQVRPAGLRQVAAFEGLTGKVQSLAFSIDGALLAAGSSQGAVRVWHVADRDRSQIWDADQGPLRALAFSPTGALLVTASDDHTIKVWTVLPWS
jgi:WD40 repeat protein